MLVNSHPEDLQVADPKEIGQLIPWKPQGGDPAILDSSLISTIYVVHQWVTTYSVYHDSPVHVINKKLLFTLNYIILLLIIPRIFFTICAPMDIFPSKHLHTSQRQQVATLSQRHVACLWCPRVTTSETFPWKMTHGSRSKIGRISEFPWLFKGGIS